MTDTTTVSAREAIEAVLADRAMTEPGFLERLTLDPKGTIGPVIAETIQDDGELDLSDVTISAHIETARNRHFVIKLDSGTDEVTGFASPRGMFGGVLGGIDLVQVARPTLAGKAEEGSHTDVYLCTASGVCACTGSECDD
ncbi:MAG: hypothetical protein ACE5GB_03995 [Acidimicrobiales bacterium]